MNRTKLTQRQLDKELISAAFNGDLDALKEVHRQGADIHAEDDRAVRLAAQRGHLEVVRYLVEEHHANIHAANQAALRDALRGGHVEVMRYLVEKGADYKKVIKEHFFPHFWPEDKIKALFTLSFILDQTDAAMHFWQTLPDSRKSKDLRQYFETNSFLALQNLKKKTPRSAQRQQKKTGTTPS